MTLCPLIGRQREARFREVSVNPFPEQLEPPWIGASGLQSLILFTYLMRVFLG